MLANTQEEYAFRVLDSPVVPEEKVRPKRMLIVISGFVIGGMGLGFVALGGIAAGWAAFGGIALALYLAVGGMAISLAYAIGGLALAPHAIGASSVDSEFVQMLEKWLPGISDNLPESEQIWLSV